MIVRAISLFAVLVLASSALAQTQTTGRIAGTMRDPNGAVIVGAEVTVVSRATGDQRKASTDSEGNYAVPLLPPGTYRVKVAASGFHTEIFDVKVVITQTTPVNVDLPLAGLIDSVVVHIAPLIQRDGPQLGRSVMRAQFRSCRSRHATSRKSLVSRRARRSTFLITR